MAIQKMKTHSIHAFPAAERMLRCAQAGMIALAFVACFGQTISAQCVDHPEKKTALVFNNESSYVLTFFIDDDEKTVLQSREVSVEWEVEPGDHLLRARAIVRGKSFWVAIVNEVVKGQICTWTVADPDGQSAAANDKYRSTFDLRKRVSEHRAMRKRLGNNRDRKWKEKYHERQLYK